jgi:Dolichyl-phosphate-mannose-protein mannosyltransferase
MEDNDMKREQAAFVTRDSFIARCIALSRLDASLALFILVWFTIGLGILLRGAQYLANRSLWYDELMLASNIVNRSFSQLLLPLDHGQGAPIGFLVVEKIALQTLGNSEFALRLFPLLCGMLSLYLFYEVARRFVKRVGVIIGLALMSLSGPLIYYSSEVKQYSSDVAIALLLYLSGLKYLRLEQPTIFDAVFLGTIGAVAIWFSHSSVFVLAAVGVSLVLSRFSEKSARSVVLDFFIYSVWAASFAFCYFFHLRYLISNEVLLKYWKDSYGFMPFPPSSLSDLKWFVSTAFAIFGDPVGLSVAGIGLFFFIVGCSSVYVRQKENFYLLVLPVPFVLLASALGKYPFSGRLLLFIVPSILILISAGVEEIRERTWENTYFIRFTLVGILFAHPMLSAGIHLIEPRTGEEIRPVLNYIMTHRHEGDVIYGYYGTDFAFKYYASRYHLTDGYIEGIRARGNWAAYARDADSLKSKRRVWVLFSHFYDAEEEFFQYYLGTIGRRLDSFKSEGAGVDLYDLSEPVRSGDGL